MRKPRLLIIGGSGFLSGTLAREAADAGWDVWAVTRGKRPLPAHVHALVADRADPAALRAAVASARVRFDLAVDCIAYQPADTRHALELLPEHARQFVFISTDFVYDPATRKFPHPESSTGYVQSENYGGQKRRCELALLESNSPMPWTIFRPCHIFGPGSLLGCSPPDNRDANLLARLRAGDTLPLVGANYLQQPIFAPDLARLILSVRGNLRAHGQIFNAAGPDVIESVRYYRAIADALGVPLKTREVPLGEYLAQHPDKAPFLCHRVYDLSRLGAAGLRVPGTPFDDAINLHVQSLL